MISLEGLADDVRKLEPGAAASRVVLAPAFEPAMFGDSSKRFNAYVSKLRETTGYELRVSTMDGIAAGKVTRCFIVERLEDML